MLPKAAPQLGEPIPNRAYVELPPVILKCPTPESLVHLEVEDKVMADIVPTQQKGKQKELPIAVPTLPHAPETVLNKTKPDRVLPSRETPQFEVIDLKKAIEKPRNPLPHYKYASEMMNKTNLEEVFQKLMDQLVTMKLGEIIGSSYEIGKQIQMAMKSQCFAIPLMEAAPVDRVCEVSNQEEEDDSEMCDFAEYTVSSGEASSSNAYMEELS